MIEPLDQITSDFYEKYLEFNGYMEFRIFDLTKKIRGKNVMFSKFARNLEDVEAIRKLYDNPNFIVYVSCNTRINKGKNDRSVKLRRTLFLDVEREGEKPPLTDKEYYQKLLDTIRYLWFGFKKMGIDPNYVGESGRGMHIGIKIMPLTVEAHDQRYRIWYKGMVDDLMRDRPHKEIKFCDNMMNPSRIQSCPGFSHNKYPERPRRRVLKLYTHENNLLPFINKAKVYDQKKKKYFSKFREKYDNVTFYQSPEWLLLANNPDLPEGEIHTKIWLMVKCLARDNKLDLELMQQKAIELGYSEVIDTPPEEIQYSPWVLFNWAMREAEYCLAKKIALPHPFGMVTHAIDKDKKTMTAKVENYPIIPLETFSDVMRYIRNFNNATASRSGQNIEVFRDLLWDNIKAGCPKPMYAYMEFLGLKGIISGIHTTLDSEKTIDENPYGAKQ